MIPYTEIKNDIRQGYENMTYEFKYYDYNNCSVILENDNLHFYFQKRMKHGPFYEVVCFKLDKDKFMDMSYKELIKFFNEYSYYNALCVEIGGGEL